MRERLIKLMTFAPAGEDGNRNVYTLVDHLLKNGVIVPPCKVGDTVYSFCNDFGVILPYFVENLRIGFMDKDRNYWCYEANCHTDETDELIDEIDFDLDDLGKTVFLSREEAEKALQMLEAEYERAKQTDYVRNPLAYALYQVWKKADASPPTEKAVRRNDRYRDYKRR